jgi:DNA-binding transcriptional MerR regulator
VSGRSHLSIGDVLSLLREEFPDVTISKIRFLESQGLVNPERSPSGYRKFFDHDVERLRWVLRQQREHFLPLKVIRDRLADGDLEGADAPNGKPAPTARTAASVPAPAAATATDVAATVADRPTKADEEVMARILADASRRAARLPDETSARRELQVVGDRGADPGVAGERTAPSSARGGTSAEASRKGGGSAGGRAGASGSTPSSGAASGAGGTGSAKTRADGSELSKEAGTPARAAAAERSARKGADQGDAPAGRSAAAIATGASLNLEELCAASGLSVDEIAGLESFGLVHSVTVAGIATYDEVALALARLAASFRSYGIEPRHLRLYRNAVDRELGLIEQVVIPLLRQRNPESRQKAMESAEQLAALGQSMRATLLERALRQLGG